MMNKMFGICLWYRLNQKCLYGPRIQDVMNHLQQYLKSFEFPAHITIKYDIKMSNKDNDYKYFSIIPKPYFTFGKLTQTVTRFQNGTEFYALQRELFLNGSTSQISTYHLSFAYNNKKFTDQQMEFVERETQFLCRIERNDLLLEMWDCNNLNPKYWKKM